HIEHDVLFDSVFKQIAGLILGSLHRRPNGLDERRNMAWKFFAIFHRLDGGVCGPTLAVTENQDQGRTEDSDGVFEAGDRMDVCEIARYAAHKDVSATAVESVFWSDPRICTSQNPGKRILPESQRGSFANEIVTFHFSFDVTFIPSHQAIKGCIRRKHVLRFWRGT